MRAWAARWLNDIWYSGRRPPLALRAAESLYREFASTRLERPVARPPVPVVVVGNLVAGGSGKTPVVAALAGSLAEAGLEVAIITRGYGGAAGRSPVRVGRESRACHVGDEALELAHAVDAPVWAGTRRREALDAALADGADVVISDDGLQHAALPRSFEICVVDGRRGFGNGCLLPAGPLRQATGRLSSVDCVLIKQPLSGPPADGLPDGAFFPLEHGELVALDRNGAAPEPGNSVDAVAGIADPESFFRDLEILGFRVRRHPLADHQPIDPEWVAALPGPVVVTAKDSMRLDRATRPDVFVLPVCARLPETVVRRVVEHVRKFGK
ncbi:MAG: tetraacyldisaccharide 4'-kinase [Candidatus Wenzhouxiangella sp. M2_3B_020]